jgi:hypothetical protein
MARKSVISLLLALLMGTLCAAWWASSPLRADVPNLQDQLEKGLKARLPSEFAFIQTVVILVDNGTLPRSLVDSTFFWVRKNRGHKKYMVPYFERILRKRAESLGIDIP